MNYKTLYSVQVDVDLLERLEKVAARQLGLFPSSTSKDATPTGTEQVAPVLTSSRTEEGTANSSHLDPDSIILPPNSKKYRHFEDLSKETRRSLAKVSVFNVEQLSRLTSSELLGLPNIGREKLRQIESVLTFNGLRLAA